MLEGVLAGDFLALAGARAGGFEGVGAARRKLARRESGQCVGGRFERVGIGVSIVS
jgi:hypothetical protein